MRKLKKYKPTRFKAKDSVYSEEMADFAVDFIEALCHTKGTWAGNPFALIDWQEQIIRDIFGTIKPNGYRQFNTAYIEIPKKQGKSELAAAVALLLTCGDGEERAEVYGCAADRQQATIVFDVAADMVRMCPALNKRVKILASQKRIIYQPTNSFYQVLSAEAYSKHGFNIHGVVFDELHTQPNRKLFDVMTKGSGDARMQPLYFLITTAGMDTNSICYETHQKAKDILEGRKHDSTFYPVIYGANEEDDWTDPKVWKKANPSLDITVGIDKVKAACESAKQNPGEENSFRQLRLNQWVKQAVRWMPMDKWDKCAFPANADDLEGRVCYGGLDLSSTTDITAFVLVFPPEDEDDKYSILPYFWIPEDTLDLRVKRDHVPYDISGRAIKYIVIHYTAGVTSKPGSAANTIDWFMNPSAQASADFCIDDANTVQYNPDIRNRYTWHCGGSNYNNKGGSLYGIAKNANSIGIEICSTNDTGRMTNANDGHYSYTDAVITRAVELVTYLMEQFGIDAAHVIRHYDVNGKPCPGIIGWNADSSDESKWNAFKARLTGASTLAASDMQATAFAKLSEADVVKKVGALFAANMKASGILASVSLAQFIQESGYGKSELAQKANNCFGMKCSLSGNTWPGSSWDGTSKYTKQTQEDDGRGNLYTIMADFRKYTCIKDSIADHSAYLLGAMNGGKKRYDGLKDCTDYKTAIQIIKDGGYATDTQYVNRICALIEKYNLTQYDTAAADTTVWYRVRKTWADSKGQKGAYKVLANAKKCADANIGYFVFDENGEVMYPLPTAFRPYMVRVAISDLNIRRGPGTNYAGTGQFTGVGSFTIVEESAGQGASSGWGKLKSGVGWISLDFCTQV